MFLNSHLLHEHFLQRKQTIEQNLHVSLLQLIHNRLHFKHAPFLQQLHLTTHIWQNLLIF